MANRNGEMADLLEMLEEEIPGFVATAKLPPPPMAGSETIEVVHFVATIDEIVFTFEDQLHLSHLIFPSQHRQYTPARPTRH